MHNLIQILKLLLFFVLMRLQVLDKQMLQVQMKNQQKIKQKAIQIFQVLILVSQKHQQFTLIPNFDGLFGNAFKVSKFFNVNKLILYIKSTKMILSEYVILDQKVLKTYQSKQLANTIYELNSIAKKLILIKLYLIIF
ncbi:unnamed protein product [Paramecium sonneborni]|uniref:Transmembrane protein n=1 Tax=Paramecium sonneborni TaxID=65129 RepID=A0A8S1RVM9_9CILI|nr:unnamed protein product [Paramecium sonneborni]